MKDITNNYNRENVEGTTKQEEIGLLRSILLFGIILIIVLGLSILFIKIKNIEEKQLKLNQEMKNFTNIEVGKFYETIMHNKIEVLSFDEHTKVYKIKDHTRNEIYNRVDSSIKNLHIIRKLK